MIMTGTDNKLNKLNVRGNKIHKRILPTSKEWAISGRRGVQNGIFAVCLC